MKRCLLLAACVALSGCFDWEKALTTYTELTKVIPDSGTVKDPDSGTPDSARCDRDWECASRQCLAGTCASAGSTVVAGGTCADLNDCTSPYVCEPRVSATYTCVLNTACLLEGRLCRPNTDTDCCPNGQCGTCAVSKCINGVCRQSPATCKLPGMACARPEDCCVGSGCGPGDGGTTCQTADAGQFPDGFMCNSVDQCQSTKCGGTPVRCQSSSVSGSGLNQTCGAGCYSAVGNAYECNSNKCCVSTGKACQSNAGCCSGQCLDGFCASQGACRSPGLGCRENGDCCSGNCVGGACAPSCAAPTESCAGLSCCWGFCGDAGTCEYPP